MPSKKKEHLFARQLLIVLTIVFLSLSIVYVVIYYAHPNSVFMDNLLLDMILERHTP